MPKEASYCNQSIITVIIMIIVVIMLLFWKQAFDYYAGKPNTLGGPNKAIIK